MRIFGANYEENELDGEGLSSLFNAWECKGKIKRVSVCKEALSVHHLLFADASFIFAPSSLKECMQIKLLLKKYEEASRQAMNFAKSCVAFSENLNVHDKQLLAGCLGMARVDYHDRYLGLPVYVGKAKKETFSYLKDWLWKKLNGWKGSLLNSAGKEILIKIMAQAIPIYTMQTFMLTKTLCDELNQLVAQYW
ncbi:uncharacterized protein [Malus domestica]|uniref:uncharacterized protein n=1 Tax=Malus domestica TaxID=3750 RepID=UPI003975D9DF